jgi:2-polyprenyl-6-methoxyphenol hydroxylase-like FAD-dependent oxidoreductase
MTPAYLDPAAGMPWGRYCFSTKLDAKVAQLTQEARGQGSPTRAGIPGKPVGMVTGACEAEGDNMRIACVGGGPAGLYFSLLMKLCDPGHDITIFERNAADSTQGWGVTFGPDLLKELHRHDPESAQEIHQAALCQFDQVVDVHGERMLHHGSGVYGINRQRLLGILADRARGLGVHIEFDREVMTSSQLPAADLIVACDGVNSRMRLEAGGFQTDVRLGGNKYLWLGTSKVFESFT